MEAVKINSADYEMLLLGIIAFWGDGKITKKEMDMLQNCYRERRKNLELVQTTDPDDMELSEKEYIIGLFDLLKSEEARISEDGIELPKDFVKLNKKKLKKNDLSNKQKVFVYLSEELGKVYDEEFAAFKKNSKSKKSEKVENRVKRMSHLQNALKGMAGADGSIDKDEKELIALTKHETHVSKWVWFWIFLIGYIIYAVNAGK